MNMPKKKISKKDIKNLWGGEGPYSEVNFIEQNRILDDGVSRIFLFVEAKINPFTFEYILKNRSKYLNDNRLQVFLDNAEYRGPYEGYVNTSPEEEFVDKDSFELVRVYKTEAINLILKMHNIVLNDFGLLEEKEKEEEVRFIWDETNGRVISTNDNIDTFNKFYAIFALNKRTDLKKNEIILSSKIFKLKAKKFSVDIVNAESNTGYMMLTLSVATNEAPTEFIEESIKESNAKNKIFRKEYFLTNFEKPNGKAILDFLKRIN